MMLMPVRVRACVAVGRSGAEVKPYITCFKVSCSPAPAMQTWQNARRKRRKRFHREEDKRRILYGGERVQINLRLKYSLAATLCMANVARVIGYNKVHAKKSY